MIDATLPGPVRFEIVARRGSAVLRVWELQPFVASTIATRDLSIVGRSGKTTLELEAFTYSPRLSALLKPGDRGVLFYRYPTSPVWHWWQACSRLRRLLVRHGGGRLVLSLSLRVPRSGRGCRECRAKARGSRRG